MAQTRKKESYLHAVPDIGTASEHAEAMTTAESDMCQICFGTGLEIVRGQGARKCQCRMREAHGLRLKKARIPLRYEKCHFNTFNKRLTESQSLALKVAGELTQNFPAVDQGILFTGPVGVGKTHLAVSIIKGLSERGFQCLFYEFGSLLKEIQDSYNPNTHTSELSVLAPVLASDLLVLDELGASKPTDWVLDTLAHIINTRYNEKKITIFTTNFPDDRSTPGKETLEDRVGVRVRSRIYEMCRTVNMDGPDHRRKFDMHSSR